jgi:hypothetical protein
MGGTVPPDHVLVRLGAEAGMDLHHLGVNSMRALRDGAEMPSGRGRALYRPWGTIVESCRSEDMVLSRITMSPPPSTVSIVRASKFGVIASKSCGAANRS